MEGFRLYNIEIPIDSGEKALYRSVLRRLGLERKQLQNILLVQKALDARGGRPRWNCTVDIKFSPQHAENLQTRLKNYRNISAIPELPSLDFEPGSEPLSHQPVVIGSGPAGLFAAYFLAKHGYKPLLFERGAPALERLQQIGRFNSGNAELDPESNVLFGEGGAGTFSDGKLYTRKNKDLYLVRVLELLVAHGASQDILVQAAPHIGTDKLAPIVVKIRESFENMGGRIFFHRKLEGFEHFNGQLKALIINGERIETELCILAIGHSARDTYRALVRDGLKVSAKPFQMGVRIEHPQDFMDQAQFGKYAGNKTLGPAEYFLHCSKAHPLEVHSFCMCPGGMIIPSVNTEGELCTNGMSFSLRNMKYANAGLVSTFGLEEFGGKDNPLAGIEFQEHWERIAYQAGGSDYTCPAQPVPDYLKGHFKARELSGSYPRGRRYVNMAEHLPKQLNQSLFQALNFFEQKIHGFTASHATLHALESRGSSPLRIDRNKEDRQSPHMRGFYPVGEGAGFAGGIMSAALDGLHSARALITRYTQPRS